MFRADFQANIVRIFSANIITSLKKNQVAYVYCVGLYIVSLIHVISFGFPLISSDEIKCPFFNFVYFKCLIDFNNFRCYFLFLIVFWFPNLILL